jgi:hypothetical protein
MPDISYQLQLAQAAQNSPMQAMSQLGTSIGNAWQGYESGNDERDLVKFFTENDTSPEKMQEFMSTHKNMPPVDVWTKASIVGRQKKAQLMKDVGKTAMNWLKNTDTKNMTMEKVQEFMKAQNMTPQQEQEFMTNFLPKAIETVKSMKEFSKKETTTVPKGSTVIGTNLSGETVELYKNPEEKLIKITSPDGLSTAEIPESQFNNPGFSEWKDWKKGTPTRAASISPKEEKMVKLYKGAGHNIQEQEVLQSQVEAEKANGWGTVRPLFAPPDRDAVIDRKTTAEEKKAAAALKVQEDRITDNIRRNDAKIKFYQAAEAKETDEVKKQSFQLTIDGFIKNNDDQQAALSHLRGGGSLVWGGEPTPVAKAAGEIMPPKGSGKKLDRANAELYKQLAGGDRAKAEQMAKKDGWVF